MTIVFVHGVPLTSAAWTPLLDELSQFIHEDVVRLSPPGFGAPLSSDFDATIDGYRNWLVDELSRFEAPVHIVGHDWGGGHVAEVAMTRPDLLRSWVSDTIAGYEPDFVWHPLAQTWQTPGEGERAIEEIFAGDADERAARMVEWGIPEPVAGEVALGQGAEMGRAILALYRSAVPSVLHERGRDLPAAAARPGLVPIATEDFTVGSIVIRHRAAERAGARAVELEGLGHWWMIEGPARAARMLAEFWNGL
ncbi:alpha/beta fold hydrolase [Streptomyces malaysiensis subsp. malaysiensis]|uniref:Alpha/beta hydrolase n=1 Tax=Streptomyces malaysiensis TaxID=92644 RepID=A0ABX6WHD7_STRMQ|nr:MULTISPECIES: alpha/beta hydrolase [Streptomyces]MCD9586858.1 alpha/beta hydrolase [Streptomyces sp. 8ZJF_21]MCQ6248728.1 alpha/beta hydrolase [Streptomyces malaysiensis]QPI60774.1 alpha/beta hydrolase [Streptomyces solisilvae]UHH22500.1 alpha/beta hydrolase [Streptomyces sp. HNM0561]